MYEVTKDAMKRVIHILESGKYKINECIDLLKRSVFEPKEERRLTYD